MAKAGRTGSHRPPPTAAVLTDEHGIVTTWSPEAESLTGHTASEMVGQPAWEICSRMAPPGRDPDAIRRRVKAMVEAILKSGRVPSHVPHPTFRIRRSDGELRTIEHDLSTIPSGEGFGLVALLRQVEGEPGHGDDKPVTDNLHLMLFEQMSSAFVIAETVLGDAGQPIDYRIVDVNPAFERLTAQPADQMIGKRASEFRPVLRQELIEQLGRVAVSGQPEEFESHDPGPDRYVRIRFSRVGPTWVMAMVEDVTEARRAEAALRERTAFAETIIASAGEGLIVYDRDLRFVVWNPVMENLTGLSSADVLGKRAPDVFPEVMAAGVRENLDRALAGESPTSRAFEFVVPQTGRHGWVLGTYRPHRNAGGQIIGVIASIRDITTRHEAEEALRRSEEQFRTIFDSVGDGVAVYGPSGPFIEVNRAMCERLGYSREKLLKMDIAAINSAQMTSIVPERIAQIMQGGVHTFETTHVGRDGTEIPVEIVSRRIEFEGQPAILCVYRDLTDRNRAERAIRDQARFLQQLIDALPIPIVARGRDGQLQLCNDAFAAGIGRPRGEIVGKTYEELGQPEAEIHSEHDSKAVRSGTAEVYEADRFLPDGTVRRHLVTKAPIRSQDGKITGTVTAGLDISDRYEAEQALRESEEQFRTIFDSVGDGMAIHEPGGLFLEVNRVVCERLGYTREELLTMPVAAINAPEWAPLYPDRIARIMREGSAVLETVHVRRDGTQIPTEVMSRRIEFRGRPAILSVQRDITERKRAEEALREQSRFLQQLLDAIPIPIVAKDKDGRVQLCNTTFATAGNRQREEIVGKTMSELGMPEAEMHQSRDDALLAGGKPQAYEAFMPMADGRMRRHVLTKAPLAADDGTVTGVVTAAVDISDRYEAEQAMQQSEERFRTLFERASDAIFIHDPIGRFIEVNQAACERLGYTRDELLTMSPAELDTPEFAALVAERVALLMAQGSAFFETAHVRRDGTAIPVEVSAAVIDLGGYPAVLSIARDISERRQAETERVALEEQLRQAQKMEGIGRLAGGIAHDFNNLLTAIRGSASLALAELPPGGGPREDLEQIEQAADRAAGLTRQLLAFARRTVLQPEVVNLSEIVRRLEPMLRRLIGEDVRLVTIAPAGQCCILADPGQIEQVIVNLAVNASDAMPNGGTLTIEITDVEPAEPSEGEVAERMTTMSVTDTGIGMDAETLEHLFEPFFTTKGPGKGTGLGLSTVYGIVRQSGGTITARSEKGRGSTFTVFLPRVEGTTGAGKEPPRRTAAGAARSGTILVVEDDGGVRRFASRVLQAAGYRVLPASDGAAAINAARGVSVQLLLTDVVMPGMSGREVAAQLATAQPGIRVLYMSGHTDKGIVHDGVLEPDIDFLAKPFTAEALLAAVDEAMTEIAAG